MHPSVTLQEFDATHLALLTRWLREEHVAPWYPDPARDIARATNPPSGSGQAIIALGTTPVGYIRWQRVDRDTLDALGLREIPENSVDADILLGSEAGVGNGIGPVALVALADRIRQDPSVPLIGLTTSVRNTCAHRGFEKAGFRIARQYDPDGRGQCHLMVLHLHS